MIGHHSGFITQLLQIQSTNSIFFDDQIIRHAENTENAVRQHICQIFIAAIGDKTFERQISVVNDDFNRRIRA